MFCRTCGYRLNALEEFTCPECGRGFDPAVPTTWSERQTGPARMLGWIALLFAPGAWWGIALHLLTYAIAWNTLGHRPQPYEDEPDSISELVRVLSGVSTLVALAFPLLTLAAVTCAAIAAWKRRQWSPWGWVAAAAALSAPTAFAFAAADPLGVFGWPAI